MLCFYVIVYMVSFYIPNHISFERLFHHSAVLCIVCMCVCRIFFDKYSVYHALLGCAV